VELRAQQGLPFGHGLPKIQIRFEDFLTRVEQGDSSLYLTTQRIASCKDGSPAALCGPPVSHMAADFPLCPPVLGNLIPSQYNLWMGNSPAEGSSSGLHHDFHDNLYVLLRGRKKFVLHPPPTYQAMYTAGSVVKMHDNGLIVYSEGIREDGSPQPHSTTELFSGAFSDSESEEEAVRPKKKPQNFCMIEPSVMSADHITRDFPLYPTAPKVEVEVRAGESLYLPAGWFHEVISQSDEQEPRCTEGGHMAFNFWMHPPDCKDYEQPYTHRFWEQRWKAGRPRRPANAQEVAKEQQTRRF